MIMKKVIVLILCIFLLVCSACSKADANIENTTDVDTVLTSETADASETNVPDTDISGIYFSIFGNEYEVNVDNETLGKLKAAESATEPLAKSLSLEEIGTVTITYKDNDAKQEFGKVFLLGSDVYVQSNENYYGAVVKFYSFNQGFDSDNGPQSVFESIYGTLK